jgi:fatty-acyl-CoA synthase
VPKQLIIRDSLPRNPSGKVLKRVLRAELEDAADG